MTKILVAIIASVLVGTIASIALFENDAFAGGGPTPIESQEDTKLHGPLLGFSKYESPNFLSVEVLPYPNISNKVWVHYSMNGDDLPSQFADGCMMSKNEINQGSIQINSTQLEGCTVMGTDSSVPVLITAQLVDNNDYDFRDSSGSTNRCFTTYDHVDEEFIQLCFESEGHLTSESVGGSASVVVDGGVPIEFDLDAEEMSTYVAIYAGQGKCNINYYGFPVDKFYEITNACQFYFGGD